MRHGVYIGPDPELQGQGAIVYPSGMEGSVEVQFDNCADLPVYLTHSWTIYPASYWFIRSGYDFDAEMVLDAFLGIFGTMRKDAVFS